MISKFHEACKKIDARSDQDLEDYFIRTKALNELMRFESEKVIAVGLKGLGKTAAFRYFTEFEIEPDIIIGINPEKYTPPLPNLNLNYETCRKQFEHDLVIEALKAVSDNRESLTDKLTLNLLNRAERQVKSYLDKLKDIGRRFGGITVLGCGFNLNPAGHPILVGLRPAKDITGALNVLKEICDSGVNIRIVVDDPEKVLSASRDLDTHLIGGFCLAALRLSELITNLKVIVLLKTHIYYPVLRDVDDLWKYPDHMARLSWTRNELIDVINERLKWAGSTWSDLFNFSDQRAKKLVESMCADLRNGPRDLLRWFDFALQAAEGRKITKDIINRTKKKMSLNSMGELESARSDEYPKLRAVIKQILQSEPNRKYNLRDLKGHIANLIVNDKEMMALSREKWMQSENSQTLPELLFKVGVIALESGGNVILPYEEDYNAINFDAAEYVFLVPALVESIK